MESVTSASPGRPRTIQGFTLIELLMVVAVITILMGIAAHSLSTAPATTMKFKATIEGLEGFFSLAYQEANATNLSHEVRWYQWRDKSGTDREGAYLFRWEHDGTLTLTDHRFVLDEELSVLDQESPLLNGTLIPQQSGKLPSGTKSEIEGRYVAIEIHPSGGNSIPASPQSDGTPSPASYFAIGLAQEEISAKITRRVLIFIDPLTSQVSVTQS